MKIEKIRAGDCSSRSSAMRIQPSCSSPSALSSCPRARLMSIVASAGFVVIAAGCLLWTPLSSSSAAFPGPACCRVSATLIVSRITCAAGAGDLTPS
jgi:hypothetical protein